MTYVNTKTSLSKEKIFNLKASQLSQAILQLKGKPLNLDDYKPFELIYDVAPESETLMAGRQIGKSVSLAASIISNSVLVSHFSTLFISPLAQQTSRFSQNYLDSFLNSPLIRKHFMDAGSIKNVYSKTFTNGSLITLGYASDEGDADRIRGVFADQSLIDEVQDVSLEAVPILEETLGASEYAFKRYTGTAKTENNSLTVLFKRSNMLEWVVKCPGCAKYNIPMDWDSCVKMSKANKIGPGCMYCGHLLDMKTGQWVAGRPEVSDHYGFHLPQIIFPARNTPKKWKELTEKVFGAPGKEPYSAQKTSNEVFGLPSGVGGRILSVRECMACCNPTKTAFDTGFPRDSRNIVTTVLGVDWSVSGSTKSYTVISILGFDFNGKAYLLHSERLNGVDILDQVRRVITLYRQFQCSMIGSDRGVGVLQGQLMQDALGKERVAMVNYVSAKNTLRWDKADNFFAADRTRNIDTLVLKFKVGISCIESPSWDITAGFWSDALNVYDEESQAGKKLYRKDEDLCDDWLHSMVFANIAYMVVKGEFSYVEQDAVEDSGFWKKIKQG